MDKRHSEHNLKVGDKVRIRSDLTAGKSYGNSVFVLEMAQCLVDYTGTIRDFDDDRLHFGCSIPVAFELEELPGFSRHYTPEMIDWDYMAKYPYFEVGDRVEIVNDCDIFQGTQQRHDIAHKVGQQGKITKLRSNDSYGQMADLDLDNGTTTN